MITRRDSVLKVMKMIVNRSVARDKTLQQMGKSAPERIAMFHRYVEKMVNKNFPLHKPAWKEKLKEKIRDLAIIRRF